MGQTEVSRLSSPTGSDLHSPGPLGVKPSKAGIPCKVCGEVHDPQKHYDHTETFRGVGGKLMPGRGPGGRRTHAQSYYSGMPGRGSILNPAVYDALRRKGMDKKSAAMISNGQLSKKTKAGVWFKKGKHRAAKGEAKATVKASETQTFHNAATAKSLRALGAARRRNNRLVAQGKQPVVGGKKVKRIKGLTKTKAKQRVKLGGNTTPKGKGPHGFTEVGLMSFFDKAAYMKQYNAQRRGKQTVGGATSRQLASHARKGGTATPRVGQGKKPSATAGLGRLNRSKKITAANPSASSVKRIARLGIKQGSIPKGTSKTGILKYVRGFAKARAKNAAYTGRHGKVPRWGRDRPALPKSSKSGGRRRRIPSSHFRMRPGQGQYVPGADGGGGFAD